MKLLIARKDRNRSGVYIIKSKITNDTYIGATKCFRKRHRVHLSSFYRNSAIGFIGEYLTKYPAESLIMKPLYFCHKNVIFDEETKAISLYSPSMNKSLCSSRITKKTETRQKSKLKRRKDWEDWIFSL